MQTLRLENRRIRKGLGPSGSKGRLIPIQSPLPIVSGARCGGQRAPSDASGDYAVAVLLPPGLSSTMEHIPGSHGPCPSKRDATRRAEKKARQEEGRSPTIPHTPLLNAGTNLGVSGQGLGSSVLRILHLPEAAVFQKHRKGVQGSVAVSALSCP